MHLCPRFEPVVGGLDADLRVHASAPGVHELDQEAIQLPIVVDHEYALDGAPRLPRQHDAAIRREAPHSLEREPPMTSRRSARFDQATRGPLAHRDR